MTSRDDRNADGVLHLVDDLRRDLGSRKMRREFRPLYPGIWVPMGYEPTFEMRSRAVARLYPEGVLVGPSAAAVHGAQLDPGFDPEIAVGNRTHYRKGIRFRRSPVPAGQLARDRHLRYTRMERTMVDLARHHPEETAVLAIEALLRTPRASARLRARPTSAVDAMAGCWSAGRATHVLGLVDPASESPWETRVRLTVRGAGITGFRSQVAVAELGFRLDLAHPEARVAIEYDGAYHRDARQQARDAVRRNRLQAAGWVVITVTASMLLGRREELLAQVRVALGARGF